MRWQKALVLHLLQPLFFSLLNLSQGTHLSQTTHCPRGYLQIVLYKNPIPGKHIVPITALGTLWVMEAYDRQFDEPRGEGAGARPEGEAEQPEDEEEEVPEGVRRFYRNSRVRVSFTYAQNYQFAC